MDDDTLERLREIGRRFYAHHADSFDSTRRRPWPGWDRVLDRAPDARPLRVLDVGCGNGRFAAHLEGHHTERRGRAGAAHVHYLGLDSSAPLLDAAAESLDGSRLGRVEWRRVDALALTDVATLAGEGPFELITLFGVLHHLPGAESRRRILRALARRLAPGGLLAVTAWRLDRFRGRLEALRVPWEAWNDRAPGDLRIDPSSLEPGDMLLSWRGDATVPRYVHFPTDAEIEATERAVSAVPGIEPLARFHADGPSHEPPDGGDNLYLLWRRRAAAAE